MICQPYTQPRAVHAQALIFNPLRAGYRSSNKYLHLTRVRLKFKNLRATYPVLNWITAVLFKSAASIYSGVRKRIVIQRRASR